MTTAPPSSHDRASGPPSSRLGYLRENPLFRRLALARLLSTMGDQFTIVAISFAVLDVTGDSRDVGLVLAARTVPVVLFVLSGGVVADLVPRKPLVVLSDSTCAVLHLVLGVVVLGERPALWIVVTLYAAIGCVMAVYRPASTGLIVDVVPPMRRQEANAFLGLATSVGAVTGPAAAGAFIAFTEPGWALVVDASTFAASALLVWWIPSSSRAVPERRSAVSALAEGWRIVRTSAWLWMTLLYFSAFQFLVLGTIFVLGPVVARDSFDGAQSWGLLLSVSGLGGVIGGLTALRIRPRRPLRAAYFSALGIVPAQLLLGWSDVWFLVVAAAMVSYGGCLAFAEALWQTTLQTNVSEAAIGRVSSFDWLVSAALRPLGLVTAGVAGGLLPVGTVLAVSGLITLALTLLMLPLRPVRALSTRTNDATGGT